jgi:Zn-dependent M28 family amino/carboxypeptidase
MRLAGGLALLVMAGCPGDAATPAGGPRTRFDGQRAHAYVRRQLEFGPRVPGTAAHRRAGDWLVETLRGSADTVLVQEWVHRTVAGDSLPLRNVLARFRPERAERVLYVAHWDTRPVAEKEADASRRGRPIPGANDGGSGTALLLALADALKAAPPAVGVDLLFVDGEDYGDFDRDDDVLIGSSWFAEHLPSPEYRPLFGVVWDMVGDRDPQFYHEGHSARLAPEVVERVWNVAAELGYGSAFVPQVRHTLTDDHLPLLRAGLRVIDVIDFDFPHHHRASDDLRAVSAATLQMVGDVALRLVSDG